MQTCYRNWKRSKNVIENLPTMRFFAREVVDGLANNSWNWFWTGSSLSDLESYHSYLFPKLKKYLTDEKITCTRKIISFVFMANCGFPHKKLQLIDLLYSFLEIKKLQRCKYQTKSHPKMFILYLICKTITLNLKWRARWKNWTVSFA